MTKLLQERDAIYTDVYSNYIMHIKYINIYLHYTPYRVGVTLTMDWKFGLFVKVNFKHACLISMCLRQVRPRVHDTRPQYRDKQ